MTHSILAFDAITLQLGGMGVSLLKAAGWNAEPWQNELVQTASCSYCKVAQSLQARRTLRSVTWLSLWWSSFGKRYHIISSEPPKVLEPGAILRCYLLSEFDFNRKKSLNFPISEASETFHSSGVAGRCFENPAQLRRVTVTEAGRVPCTTGNKCCHTGGNKCRHKA